MLKNLIALFLFVGQGFFCFAQIEEYQINLNQSAINFKVAHMGVLSVEGEFQQFSGKLLFNEGKLNKVTSSIAVESINTGDKSRDKILTDKGYLDVKNYPNIKFSSTQILLTSKEIIGILKIKNIEKRIKMPFQLINPKNGKQPYLKISTLINRKTFKLDFGPMDLLIGDDIKIELKIVYFK